MALSDERGVDLITYDQVREREFASPSMAAAALVVSYFSDRVPPADINSLNITRLNLDVALETRNRRDDGKLFAAETGAKIERAGLRSYYNEGLAVLTRNGVVPLSVITDVELRLADLGKSKLGYGVSAFGYKHLAFPADIGEDISTAEISVNHVVDNVVLVETVLANCGLDRQISKSQLFGVALTSAIMHEYGHALRTYIQIKMAEAAVKAGDGGTGVETVQDLLDQKNRDYFWELFAQVENVSAGIIMGGVSDVSKVVTLLESGGMLDYEGIAAMSHESLAQGLEYFEIRKLMSGMLAKDELPQFEEAFDNLVLKKQGDYLYYLQLCEQKGLSAETIGDFVNSIRQGYYRAGLGGIIPWMEKMPFYAHGLGIEQAGYYFPVQPENIRSCVNQMLAQI